MLLPLLQLLICDYYYRDCSSISNVCTAVYANNTAYTWPPISSNSSKHSGRLQYEYTWYTAEIKSYFQTTLNIMGRHTVISSNKYFVGIIEGLYFY